MKRCARCKRPRRLAAFAKDRKRKDGLYPYCRECQAKYAKQWREQNRDRELAKARERYSTPQGKRDKREWHLRYKYGIDLQEYDRLRKRQKGRCPLCKGYFGAKLVVDHDHRTGRVRGLLCNRCNSDISLIDNKPRMLSRIVKYLSQV